MKKQYVITFLLCILLASSARAQGVGINTSGLAPDSSAILDVSATDKGALFPRMTTAQRNVIPSPATGLLIYNLDIGCYQYFDGASWFDLCGEQKEKPLMLPWRTGVGNWSTILNIFTDKYILITKTDAFTGGEFRVVLPNYNNQQRSYLLDWPGAGSIISVVVIGNSLYLMLRKTSSPQESRVYRYDLYNIGAGGAQVTFSGLGLLYNIDLIMTSNGSDIYFNYNAGNSSNDYIVARYSITSPTVFTYQTSVTCGSVLGSFERLIVDQNNNFYGGAAGTANTWYKYNSSGVFVYQTVNYDIGNGSRIWNLNNTYYMQGSEAAYYYYRIWLE